MNRAIGCATGLLGGFLMATVPAVGQVGALLEVGSSAWVSKLPASPHATMGSKLERTILSVDILNLTLRLDPETANRLTQAIAGIEKYDEDHEAAVAEIAIAPREAVAEIVFMRGIDLDQFLDGINDDMIKAVEVGWLGPDMFVTLRDSLPIWFGFLEERKIRSGDRLQYHVRADTIRTVFWGIVEEEMLLDQTDVGSQNVMALLGAYFAPKSSFRKELVESLWKGWDPSRL